MLPVPDLVTDFDVLLVVDGLVGIRLMLDTAGALHCKSGLRSHELAHAQSMTAVTLHARACLLLMMASYCFIACKQIYKTHFAAALVQKSRTLNAPCMCLLHTLTNVVTAVMLLHDCL